MVFDLKQKAGRLLRLSALVLLITVLAGCTPAAGETQAAATPQVRRTIQPVASSTALPTSTSKPTRMPTQTPTTMHTATVTAEPTQTNTPTLPPGMVRVSGERVMVPILLYHRISDQSSGRYIVPLRMFRQQMKLLSEEGYQTISISQLADVIRQGGVLPEKAVVITFDDGYLDTFTNAFPILQEYGFTGVTYIITSTFEKNKSYGTMQERELKELLAAGWEIGSHSVTHYDLKKTKLGAGNEVQQSKETLEALLGVPVRSFCYPYGVANQSIKDLVKEAGYESAVGLGILLTHTNESLYYLSRQEVMPSMQLSTFRKLLVPKQDESALNDITRLTPTVP